MLRQIFVYLGMDFTLTVLDVIKGVFDLFLQRGLEIEFVDRIQRYDRMQQMISIQALGTNLFFAFQTEQDEVLSMRSTFIFVLVFLINAIQRISWS